MASNSEKHVTIFVQLLEEGTFCTRPTKAISLGKGLFRLLPAPNYDPEDEIWEFLPGSVVRMKTRKSASGETCPLAVKP